MSDAPVLVEVDGPIGLITVNRPETLNAIDVPTCLALAAALDRLEADAAVRVSIVTGAGRAFVAGGVIADLPSSPSLAHDRELAQDIHRVFTPLDIRHQPTFARGNAHHLGGAPHT